MIESAAGRAIRGFAARRALSVPKVRARIIAQLSGVGYAYPAPGGAHELVGTRATDVPLGGGGRLYEALRDRRFVLVGAADVTGWQDRVHVSAPATPGGPTVLVRPDGYVGWAGTDTTGLRPALAELAGTPTTA
ncbi:hypothetical protein ACFQYP_24750 [Nonomuraea antimicrobica]